MPLKQGGVGVSTRYSCLAPANFISWLTNFWLRAFNFVKSPIQRPLPVKHTESMSSMLNCGCGVACALLWLAEMGLGSAAAGLCLPCNASPGMILLQRLVKTIKSD